MSHDQESLLADFLADLARLDEKIPILVTDNLPLAKTAAISNDTRVVRHTNVIPKGFSENHNAAFRACKSPFFCVANPDVRLLTDPFPRLLDCFADHRVGLVAPLVLTPSGEIEDSARDFPTPSRLLAKFFRLGMNSLGNADSKMGPSPGRDPVDVDWVAGMFMLFRAEAFRDVGGFDGAFFLYYEDVDICARLWQAGWKVIYHPGISIIHDARRSSRRDPHYMRWHAASMLRYLWKHYGRLPKHSA